MAQDTPVSRGVVASDPQNQPDPKGIHTRSFFSENDLGADFFATLPFGEVRPFTFFETVPDDKRIRAQFKSQVMSYTLKSRLMQDIHMKKLLVQVPREAILPINWDKWFKNPVIGQDVSSVAPDCGTSVAGFWHIVSAFMNAVFNSYDSSYLDSSAPSILTANAASHFIEDSFRLLLLCELFYSDGNLLKFCRISGRPWAFSLKSDGHTQNSVDYVFDKFCNQFLAVLTSAGFGDNNFTVTFGSDVYTVDVSLDTSHTYPGAFINLREMLSLMRDDLTFQISGTWTTSQISAFDALRSSMSSDVEYYLTFVDDNPADPADRVSVDLKRLWAYQLAYFHFLTNDSVDFVYSSELFREYIHQLVTRVPTPSLQNSYDHCFVVNGLQYHYDYMSAYYFWSVLDALTDYYTNGVWPNAQSEPDSANEALAYLTALFGFNRSLRYLDYFTGAKTRPLAVGDVTVAVNANTVNVVDTQAKTFLARFLNVINRVGMRNYVKAVFGTDQAPDWHNPQYLVKIDDIVYGQQVENTGAQQFDPDYPNSITTLLHGNSDRYAFEMDFDRSSIIVGLVWFDIDRVYSMATERQNLHFDRFDEFQPFMQYTGDQALMRVELGSPLVTGGSGTPATAPFGYKLRNAEYKERYDQCAGGFCTDMLDAYLFKADIMESSAIQSVNPMFIRSFPSELDRFYLSLTGFSLATYFHFICRFTDNYSGSRPMAYAPTLM